MSSDLFLTLAIPSFNRSAKLLSILRSIDGMLHNLSFKEQIEIIVSNNGSSDSSAKDLESYLMQRPRSASNLRVFNQATNIGFDLNVKFLYENARGQYLWFLSDDDILYPQAIERIFTELKARMPSILLFEFQQPAGSTEKVLSKVVTPGVHSDAKTLINLVSKQAKLSSYIVYRGDALNLSGIDQFIGSSYWFVALSLSILHSARSATGYLIGDFLAHSDSDYKQINFPPETWLNYFKIFLHPYVVSIQPERWQLEKIQSYKSYVNFLYNVQVGLLQANDSSKYIQAAKELRVPWSLVFSDQSILLKALLVRFNLAGTARKIFRNLSFGRDKVHLDC
jgi:glycosyltransferase involved in cell wall biosynthesis